VTNNNLQQKHLTSRNNGTIKKRIVLINNNHCKQVRFSLESVSCRVDLDAAGFDRSTTDAFGFAAQSPLGIDLVVGKGERK